MDEIVVALRETRRAAGRSTPFTLVGGQRSDKGTLDPPEDAQNVTSVTELRDNEIQRLLTENARLNERVMFLLKVIEQQQPRDHAETAAGISHDAIVHSVNATLEAELRPVLDVLLRLLEKLHASPVTLEPHNDGGIIDLDAPPAHE